MKTILYKGISNHASYIFNVNDKMVFTCSARHDILYLEVNGHQCTFPFERVVNDDKERLRIVHLFMMTLSEEIARKIDDNDFSSRQIDLWEIFNFVAGEYGKPYDSKGV